MKKLKIVTPHLCTFKGNDEESEKSRRNALQSRGQEK